MYDQKLTAEVIVRYLEHKGNTSLRDSKSPIGKDIYLTINGENLGRISISETDGVYSLYSAIQGKFSKIKEKKTVLEQLAFGYGVKIAQADNETVSATKRIESLKDVDKFYNFCVSEKNIRYRAMGDQTKSSFGLEQLLPKFA